MKDEVDRRGTCGTGLRARCDHGFDAGQVFVGQERRLPVLRARYGQQMHGIMLGIVSVSQPFGIAHCRIDGVGRGGRRGWGECLRHGAHLAGAKRFVHPLRVR